MTLKDWVRFKNAARRNRDINHWVSSPSGRDHGVVITGTDLLDLTVAIDAARDQVRGMACENAPYECKAGEEGRRTVGDLTWMVPCHTCALKWALAKVIEDGWDR